MQKISSNQRHTTTAQNTYITQTEVSFEIQLKFNASNTFGTMKRCSGHGYFELMSVNHSATPGAIKEMSFRFSLT